MPWPAIVLSPLLFSRPYDSLSAAISSDSVFLLFSYAANFIYLRRLRFELRPVVAESQRTRCQGKDQTK